MEGKKTYEISFLANQSEGGTALLPVLKQQGAEISYQSPIQEIRLAYPIKKYKQGYFGFLHFSAEPDNVDKILQSLKLNPVFLRVLIVNSPVASKTDRAERTPRPRTPVAEAAPAISPVAAKKTLSNEALEQKLEEILK